MKTSSVKKAAVKAAAAKKAAPVAAVPFKKETVKSRAIELLRGGVSSLELQQTFSWLPHTTRGFVSILGKTMHIEAVKKDGVMWYTASDKAPVAAPVKAAAKKAAAPVKAAVKKAAPAPAQANFRIRRVR